MDPRRSSSLASRYLLFGQRASIEAEEESVRLPSHGRRVRLEEEGADEMHQSRGGGRFGKLSREEGVGEENIISTFQYIKC